MWVVCAYFTKNSPYEEHAKNLIQSLHKLDLSYEVTPVACLGDWDKNTQFKPTFLLEMLTKYSPHSIIYTDVDAVFCRYPEFFDTLDRSMPDVNISAHVLDHTKYRRKQCAPELLSGTIFLRNNSETFSIVKEWIEECKKDPKLWDQRALAKVLEKHSFYNLPEEYTVIFDYMESVKDPVIKHFQASRVMRNRRENRPKKPKVPRIVVSNGILRIGRIHK